MSLDILTALVIIAFASAVAGGLLLISWLQHRNVLALVAWSLAFVLTAAAAMLIAARGQIPDFWSIAIANAILAVAYGCMWSGARLFEGHTPRIGASLAGALIWLLACTSDAIYSSPTARVTLTSAIGVTYSLLTAAEFWRPQDKTLASRWLVIGLLLLHAASLPLRIPLAGSLVDTHADHTSLLTLVTFESVLLSMCGAYLFGSIVKERIAQRYKRASLVDPLTGVDNRRWFLKQAPRIVRRSRLARQSLALLLFDLDHFKSVNDTFGHTAGDSVLTAFCRVAEGHMRPTDLFARLGGEEFACLLPGASRHDALSIAERVRAAFEATDQRVGQEPFAATVSVGVAVAEGSDCDLHSLLEQADAALYRAKRLGRNRVELADAPALEPAAQLLTRPARAARQAALQAARSASRRPDPPG
jgi:diguanylate cyclase (GGDEF)-like protein